MNNDKVIDALLEMAAKYQGEDAAWMITAANRITTQTQYIEHQKRIAVYQASPQLLVEALSGLSLKKEDILRLWARVVLPNAHDLGLARVIADDAINSCTGISQAGDCRVQFGDTVGLYRPSKSLERLKEVAAVRNFDRAKKVVQS